MSVLDYAVVIHVAVRLIVTPVNQQPVRHSRSPAPVTPCLGFGLAAPDPPVSSPCLNTHVCPWEPPAFLTMDICCAFEEVHFSTFLLSQWCFCESLKHFLCPLGENWPIWASLNEVHLGTPLLPLQARSP